MEGLQKKELALLIKKKKNPPHFVGQRCWQCCRNQFIGTKAQIFT